MRTNFLNKHGMKLILAIFLIVAVLTTAVVSAYFMISTKNDTIIDNGNGNNTDAPNNMSTKVDTVPLKDGEVPGGSETFKQKYASNSDWIAISDQDQMRNWLANNNNKNAYLANDISYVSSSGSKNGFAAWATNSQLDSVSDGRIFDGCGYKIELTPDNVQWVDSVWQEKSFDNRYPYSLFAAYNGGTIRNVKYSLQNKTLNTSDGGSKNAVGGLVAGYSAGQINNIFFDFGSSFALHLNDGNNAVWVGVIAGSNRGTISHCTVLGRNKSSIDSAGKGYTDWKGKTYPGYSYTGVIVGESIYANEYNNTVISEGMNIHADGFSVDASGACVGEKKGGQTFGFVLIGATQKEGDDNCAAVVGQQLDSIPIVIRGVYTDYSAGFATANVIARTSAPKTQATQIFPEQYDVVFEKSANYYESNVGIPNNLILTPKSGTVGSQRPSKDHIPFSVQYKNATGESIPELAINNLAKELITGSLRVENVWVSQRNSIVIDYGQYGIFNRYDIAKKEYNGQGQAATGTVTYRTPTTGIEKTVSIDISSLKILYDDQVALPINATTYSVNASGYYLDEVGKFYGYNPNKATTTMTITPKDIKFDVDKFSLNNYSKTYDNTSDAPTAEANPYATGILSDKLTFEVSAMQYLNKDVGTDKPLTFGAIFNYQNSLTNSNYTLDGRTYNNITVTVNRGIITHAQFTLPSGAIGIDLLTKTYDKTDSYKGQVTVGNNFDTQFGEKVSIDNVNVNYNSKNVDADKIIATYDLLADNVSKNYVLTTKTVEFSNASITPYHISANWGTFANETFYKSDGSTNISRPYDATNSIDGNLLAVNKPFTTAIGELIKLKYVSGTLNDKNSGNNKPLLFKFAFDELAVGSQDINGVAYDIADYRNYALDNTTVDTSATVTPKVIEIVDNPFDPVTTTKKYDGTTNYVGEAIAQKTINGVASETITLSSITAVYNSKDVVSASKITVSFKQTDGNYSLNITPIDNVYTYDIVANIEPHHVVISGDMLNVVATKAYDTTTDYVGVPISQKDIKVTLTGGEESIILGGLVGVYADANVNHANNSIIISISQSNSNFTIDSDVSVSATITPHVLTLQNGDFNCGITKVYDGNTNATVSQNAIIGLADQSIILDGIVANFNSKNVDGANEITIGFGLASNDINGNYSLKTNAVTADGEGIAITAKPVTVSVADFAEFIKTKAYDSTDVFGGTITLIGGVSTGVLAETITVDVDSAKFNTSVVKADGSVRIIAQISQSDTNYTINNSVEFEAEITPFVLNGIDKSVFTIDGAKVYDGSNAVADDKVVANSFASGVASENVILTKTSAIYNSKDVANANAITIEFSVADTNYAIGDVKSLSYNATISAKDIALTRENFKITINKSYDKNTNAVVTVVDGGILTGIISDEIQEVLVLDTLTATYNSSQVREAENINIKFSTVNTNYNITNLADGITVDGTISAHEITVTEGNFTVTKEKTYDGNTVAKIKGYSIIANDESINLDDGYAAMYASKDVANNMVVTVTFAESLDNYIFKNSSITYSGCSIVPKQIDVKADAFTYDEVKKYNALTNYVGSDITAKTIKTGVVVNDVEEELTLIIGEATYNSKNVDGAEKINLLLSQNNANYTINGNIDLAATITPYTVSDNMEDMARYTLTTEKVFDGSNSAVISINDGYVNINGLQGETFTYQVTAKYASINIGVNIAINITVVSNDGNYRLNITTFLGAEDGKITAAMITVTIENFNFDKVKQYDGTTKVIINDYTILGAANEEIALAEGYHAEYNDSSVGNAKTITIYFAPADDGYSFSNESVTYTPGEGENCEITKRNVALTNKDFDYSDTKQYDGTVNYDNNTKPISVKNSGAVATGVGTDTIIVNLGDTHAFNNANVGEGNFIIVSVSIDENANYVIDAVVNLEANITPKTITVRESDFDFKKSKTYDGNDKVLITASEIGTGVGAETITLTNVSAIFNSKNVADANTITIQFSQANNNYALNVGSIDVSGEGVAINTYVINKENVTADVTKSKTYDGNTTVAVDNTTISVTTGETVAVASAVATYDNKNVAATKTITFILTITDGNYSLGFANIVFEDGAIIQKTITVQDGDINAVTTKAYDGTTEYVGEKISHELIAGACGDDVITLEFGNATFNSKNVKEANALTVNFTQADGNYVLASGSIDKTATITPYTINVTETDLTFDKTRAYDGSVNVVIAQKTISGVNGEKIALGSLTAKYNSKNVIDANSILVEFALSENDTNYVLNQITFGVTGDDVHITTYMIQSDEVTADVTKSKVYDGNTTVAVGNTTISVTTGETVAVASAVATYDNKNVAATKTITFIVTITDGNYSLGFANIVFEDGAIIQKPITVQDGDINAVTTKVYDGTTEYVGEKISHELIAGACGDDVITLEFGNATYNSKNVKEANALTVKFTQADGNYVLASGSIDKAATITPYTIDLKEGNFLFNKSRVYNNTDTLGVKQGTVNGVKDETVNLVNIKGVYNSKNVEFANAITLSFALDESFTNYKLSMSTMAVSGDIAITPFVLTNEHVDFTYAATKVYDTKTEVKNISYTFNNGAIGFADDELVLASYSATYSDKNVDTNKVITFIYSINNINYTLGVDIASLTKTYDDGIITMATIAPVADEFEVAKSRQYTGDNSSALSTTNTVLGVNGETVPIAVATTFFLGEDFNVGADRTIKITFAMTDDANNKNYSLSNTFVEITNCEITPMQITLKPNDFDITTTKVYDGQRNAHTAQTYTINGVSNEEVVLTVSSALFNSANVSNAQYITIKVLLASNNVNKNYIIMNEDGAVVYTDGVAINPTALTVSFSNTEQSYRNNPNPLSKIILTITNGLIGKDEPVLKLTDVSINIGEKGEYDLIATTTDANYYIANSSTLTLDVFAMADGRWLIENIGDFNLINTDSKYLAYNFTQIADIDIKHATMVGIKGDFTGSYDGNNFMIKNAFLYGAPLFESLSGSVTNLAVVNTVIISYTDAKIGGIVGVVNTSGIIENVVFEGSIYIAAPTDAGTVYAGGIAAENNGRISSVKVLADITVKADVSCVGGIVGKNVGAITAVSKDGVKDFNVVMVQIFASGAGANVDAVAGNNTSTLDANDTVYLKNANVKEVNAESYEVVNSTLGTGMTFKGLTSTESAMFAEMKTIDFINAYRNDSNLKLSSDYVLEINNLRDYALIGQYNYLNIVFKTSFIFHKHYEHSLFNKLLVGSITVHDDVQLDSRIGGIANIFKYNQK